MKILPIASNNFNFGKLHISKDGKTIELMKKRMTNDSYTQAAERAFSEISRISDEQGCDVFFHMYTDENNFPKATINYSSDSKDEYPVIASASSRQLTPPHYDEYSARLDMAGMFDRLKDDFVKNFNGLSSQGRAKQTVNNLLKWYE